MMSGAAVELKENVEQKEMFDRMGRYDFVYVMLDKRIDYLSDEIKEVRNEVKDLRDEMRSEFKDVRNELKELRNEVKEVSLQTIQRIESLFAQMVSMKLWGIGLLITILLVVLAPHIISLLG